MNEPAIVKPKRSRPALTRRRAALLFAACDVASNVLLLSRKERTQIRHAKAFASDLVDWIEARHRKEPTT